MIQEQYSRISHHTITATGLTGTTLFTVPLTEDFTDDSWSITDLALSEIGVAEGVGRAFIRIGDEIKEFNFSSGGTSSTAGTLEQVLTAGNTTGTQDIIVTTGTTIQGQTIGALAMDSAVGPFFSRSPNIINNDDILYFSSGLARLAGNNGLNIEAVNGQLNIFGGVEIKIETTITNGEIIIGNPVSTDNINVFCNNSLLLQPSNDVNIAPTNDVNITPTGHFNANADNVSIQSITDITLGATQNILIDANDDINLGTPGNTNNIFIEAGAFIEINTTDEDDFRFNDYAFKEISLGDWNMDTTATLTVAHTLSATEWKTIRNIGITIRNDADTTYYDLAQSGGGNLDSIDNTNFSLSRIATGIFDNTNFDATTYNRGFIRFQYKPD